MTCHSEQVRQEKPAARSEESICEELAQLGLHFDRLLDGCFVEFTLSEANVLSMTEIY